MSSYFFLTEPAPVDIGVLFEVIAYLHLFRGALILLLSLTESHFLRYWYLFNFFDADILLYLLSFVYFPIGAHNFVVLAGSVMYRLFRHRLFCQDVRIVDWTFLLSIADVGSQLLGHSPF